MKNEAGKLISMPSKWSMDNDRNWVSILARGGRYRERKEHCLSLWT